MLIKLHAKGQHVHRASEMSGQRLVMVMGRREPSEH